MSELLQTKNMNLLKLQRYQQHREGVKIKLGLLSWESEKLRGTLYDEDTPPSEFLSLYSKQFDVVEYQDSFLEVPSEKQIEKMRQQVKENKDFTFCPYVPRKMSHEAMLNVSTEELKSYFERLEGLRQHLGPCLLKLPEVFGVKEMNRLIQFLEKVPEGKSLTIQFTNPEWAKDLKFIQQLIRTIKNEKIGILIKDDAGLSAPLEKLICGENLMIRYEGSSQLQKDEHALAMWVYRLAEYQAYNIKMSYFFLDEQEEMSLNIMKKMANSIGGIRVPQKYDLNARQGSFNF